MKTLSIVIPIFNESTRIYRATRALEKYVPPRCVVVEKIRFVDDGSTDKTVEKLEKWCKKIAVQSNAGKKRSWLHKADIEIISYAENKGRGYAVRTGMRGLTSDYALYLDADMSIPLSNLSTFLPEMKKGVDCIVGSKKMPETITKKKGSISRQIVGYGHTVLLQFVLGIKVYDFTGGFKIFSRRLYRRMFPRLWLKRWGFDPEVIYVANKYEYSIKELPLVWSHVSTSSKVQLVRDILWALREMFEIRLNDILGLYDTRPVVQRMVQWIKLAPRLRLR